MATPVWLGLKYLKKSLPRAKLFPTYKKISVREGNARTVVFRR